MTSRMKVAITAAALTCVVAAPAQADTIRGYDKPARSIAEAGNCRDVRRESAEGIGIVSKATCDLRGKKVEILTFSKKMTEARFVYRYCDQLPTQRVMLGAGFVVTGGRSAVEVARRVFGGEAYRCSDLV